jgi:hypothetical protein
MPETEDHQIAVALAANPRPNVVKWRYLAISEALTTEAAQPRRDRQTQHSQMLSLGPWGPSRRAGRNSLERTGRRKRHQQALCLPSGPPEDLAIPAQADGNGGQQKGVRETAYPGQCNLAPKDPAPPKIWTQRHGAARIGPDPRNRPIHVGQPSRAQEP